MAGKIIKIFIKFCMITVWVAYKKSNLKQKWQIKIHFYYVGCSNSYRMIEYDHYPITSRWFAVLDDFILFSFSEIRSVQDFGVDHAHEIRWVGILDFHTIFLGFPIVYFAELLVSKLSYFNDCQKRGWHCWMLEF